MTQAETPAEGNECKRTKKHILPEGSWMTLRMEGVNEPVFRRGALVLKMTPVLRGEDP